MGEEGVPAFRKRGLRPGVCRCAEPPCLVVKQNNERRHMNLIQYIGLDVHNESLAISIASSDGTEVRRWGIMGGTHEHMRRLVQQLPAAHPEANLKFCYEAGPRGYPLARFLLGLGHECLIVCPSRVPRRPGDRVKTDR